MAALALAAALFAINVGMSQSPFADSPASSTTPRGLSVANKSWTGDFDRMFDRRMIRVLVPYSRTLYFTDKGRERGLTAELVRDFERYVNQKYKMGKRPSTVCRANDTGQVLPMLVNGLGDIAAGNLNVTEVRLKQVDYVVQTDRKPVKKLVVLGAGRPRRQGTDDRIA